MKEPKPWPGGLVGGLMLGEAVPPILKLPKPDDGACDCGWGDVSPILNYPKPAPPRGASDGGF